MDIEVTNGHTEKFIPHPILDDPVKMMRIIANPVYDKMTISRAAQIQKRPSLISTRKSVRISQSKVNSTSTPLKSLNTDETMITPITTLTSNPPPQPKSILKLPSSFLLRSTTNQTGARNSKPTIRSRTGSLHSSFNESDKKSSSDAVNVRYVNTEHGFEIQRYSSPNWLAIDLLTKDACESQEKTFREMLDKKEQTELSARSVFTSQYYRQRFEDLLQSYRNGELSHDQWARQNYQLHCLKTFYTYALEREQQRESAFQQGQRQRHVQRVFNEWKEAKGEGQQQDRHRSRLNTANSHRLTEVNSISSHPSSSNPNATINRASVSSGMENISEDLPVLRTSKQTKQSTKGFDVSSFMLDEQRWSLDAMLKRVVGLAEPLPPPPKIINGRQSSLTNLSNDSGFESGP